MLKRLKFLTLECNAWSMLFVFVETTIEAGISLIYKLYNSIASKCIFSFLRYIEIISESYNE